MSTTLKNIKIPYPTEGVIRSAQLNDTVAPENSVQLAVNMNFDRVGALQTRPGVETYATSLTGEIQNFGTLNNSVEIVGYSSIDGMGEPTEIGTFSSSYSLGKIDDTHFIYFHEGTSIGGDTNKGYVQVGLIDPNTGAVTFLGTQLEIPNGSSTASQHSCQKIDANHFIDFYSGTSQDGYAQVFAVDLSTWAVTAVGTPVNFDADLGYGSKSVQLDSTHFVNTWTNTTSTKIQVFEVSLSTWNVITKSTAVNFPTTFSLHRSIATLGDGLRVIVFYDDNTDNDGFVQVYEANNSTWALTAKATALEFDNGNGTHNSCASMGDGQHFINFYKGPDGGYARTFEVNLSTYAVTTKGALLKFDLNGSYSHGLYNSCVSMGDGIHFTNTWYSGAVAPNYSAKSQVFEVDLSTFDITASSNISDLITFGYYGNSILMSQYKVLYIAGSTGTSPGPTSIVLFNITGGNISQNLLYAQEGDAEVYAWDGASWAIKRTGLLNNQKARFTQFLNYIWMVNGNSTIGDAINTSNGGTFGTDLIPAGLPPGDYIQAGFEGRVWVMDVASDAIYYTDIVQFTPPSTYTLTYNAATNYLKNFSSQDGQKMTGLVQVPRALLVFKEDSIYRIYGAASVDAYPAYNVGTYSNESIVKTKDGIYFHHSSGFYKFDYGGQPIEISRRVIDFVKAIPRSSYENIVGIWDGFDAVKWTVGTVTVEGVTYTNCQMRYTISTQVWTIYDYEGNTITALISFDNGTTINQLMGTTDGVVAKLDSGTTDLGEDIYFEMIDRWRSFTEMYSKSKAVSGVMVSSDNGAGTVLEYQTEKSQPNVYQYIDVVKDQYDALFPNASTDDFNNIRFRLRGNSRGTPMIFHGIELLSIQDKGLNEN
jgi:hypothetical protein